MKELRVANEYLGDPTQLHALLETEGYLFFRDLIDLSLVEHVRHGVMAWFGSRGYIDVRGEQPIYTGADLTTIGEYPPELYETHLWERFALRNELQNFYHLIFGEAGRVVPIGEYQFSWPGKPGSWDRAHQEGPFFNHIDRVDGAGLDFVVCWFPLIDIDESVGGLAIIPRPRSAGAIPPGRPGESTARLLPQQQFAPGEWHRIDYRPGDALVFGPFTPHCGLPNTSDRLRLSIDFRVERASAAPLISGVVIAGGPDRIVVAADREGEIELSVNEHTAFRWAGYAPENIDARSFLGRRVLITAREGRALVVRNTWGYLPVAA